MERQLVGLAPIKGGVCPVDEGERDQLATADAGSLLAAARRPRKMPRARAGLDFLVETMKMDAPFFSGCSRSRS